MDNVLNYYVAAQLVSKPSCGGYLPYIESTYLSGLFTTLKGSKGYAVVRALAFHKCSPGSNTTNTGVDTAQ